jgi:hypothetical protein
VRRWGARLIAIFALTGALAGCGGDDLNYRDAKIIERLDLKQSGNGYAIGGEAFCEVEDKLLNNAAEVESAADRDELGLVIASREGNVGVKGVPVFNPDCAELAKKKLNKLDAPAE